MTSFYIFRIQSKELVVLEQAESRVRYLHHKTVLWDYDPFTTQSERYHQQTDRL